MEYVVIYSDVVVAIYKYTIPLGKYYKIIWHVGLPDTTLLRQSTTLFIA